MPPGAGPLTARERTFQETRFRPMLERARALTVLSDAEKAGLSAEQQQVLLDRKVMKVMNELVKRGFIPPSGGGGGGGGGM